MSILFLYLSLLFSFSAQNQDHTNIKNGVGIKGYDPVAYFEADGAREGMKSIQASHGSVTYYFTSEEHKTVFQSDPEKYLPEYGGWCAYAIGASGDKVKVDPETFKILDDKLYLFYNFKGYNTMNDWNEDESNLLVNAEKYWASIINN